MKIQKIHKKYSLFEKAKKYYTILFILNDLPISFKEIDLVAFCAIKGTISTPPVRDEFVKLFHSSKNTVYNMSAKLQKQGIFIKTQNKIKINPVILLDFSEELFLAIKLSNDINGTLKEENSTTA